MIEKNESFNDEFQKFEKVFLKSKIQKIDENEKNKSINNNTNIDEIDN
jgi:hypothetical protein